MRQLVHLNSLYVKCSVHMLHCSDQLHASGADNICCKTHTHVLHTRDVSCRAKAGVLGHSNPHCHLSYKLWQASSTRKACCTACDISAQLRGHFAL